MTSVNILKKKTKELGSSSFLSSRLSPSGSLIGCFCSLPSHDCNRRIRPILSQITLFSFEALHMLIQHIIFTYRTKTQKRRLSRLNGTLNIVQRTLAFCSCLTPSLSVTRYGKVPYLSFPSLLHVDRQHRITQRIKRENSFARSPA